MKRLSAIIYSIGIRSCKTWKPENGIPFNSNQPIKMQRYCSLSLPLLAMACFGLASVATASDDCPTLCKCGSDFLHCSGPISVDELYQSLTNGSIKHANTIRSFELTRFEWTHLNLTFLSAIADTLETIKITHCNMLFSLDFDSAIVFHRVRSLNLSANFLYSITGFDSVTFPALETLSLADNQFGDDPSSGLLQSTQLQDCRNSKITNPQIQHFTSLRRLDLSGNRLRNVSGNYLPPGISILDLSRNEINSLDISVFPVKLLLLNVSRNQIKSLVANWKNSKNLLATLENFDISRNQFTILDPEFLRVLPNLKSLQLNGNPLVEIRPDFPAHDRLQNIFLSQTRIKFIDLTQFRRLRRLERLDISLTQSLYGIHGRFYPTLPSLRFLNVSGCGISEFSLHLFNEIPQSLELDLSGNRWACDCRLMWRQFLPQNVRISADPSRVPGDPSRIPGAHCESQKNKSIFEVQLNLTACLVGVSREESIVHANYGESWTLACPAFGIPEPMIAWERLVPRPPAILGAWNSALDLELGSLADPEKYRILPGGRLLIDYPTRDDIGLYRCLVRNENGNASHTVSFRISYDHWTMMKVYSIFCGIGTALGFFALNCIYAGIRNIILWRISHMERTSKARALLSSIEKYQRRQIESLQQKYTAKMQGIRDNYNAQVANMRSSYSSQMGRFRDYRTAQMDNYYAQMNRMRDYGSRQMERLWDSYQAQMNRIRAFSLQQRLRLMRQYRLKHKYVEKLLKSLNKSSAVKADNPPPLDPGWIELPMILPDDYEGVVGSGPPPIISEEDLDFDENDDDFHSIPEEIGDLATMPDWGIDLETADAEITQMVFDEQAGPSSRLPVRKSLLHIEETNL